MIGLPSGDADLAGDGFDVHEEGLRRPCRAGADMLGEDPLSGHLFVFAGRRGHLAKVLWWSGDGYCLFSKRLDRGHFVWPQASSGTTVVLSEAQLSMLLEGIDWRRPERTWRPDRPG
jgi:transposase